MKRFAWAALAAILFAAPSLAETYHVRANASTFANRKAGTSYSTAWRTISQANATAVTGDVVYLYPGSYNDSIAPTAIGVTFIGASTTADPLEDSATRGRITVPGMAAMSAARGTVVKGVTFLSDLTVPGPVDSIIDCQINGGLTYAPEADSSVVLRCNVDGLRISMAGTAADSLRGAKLISTTAYHLGNNNDGGNSIFTTSESPSITIERSRFDITMTPKPGGASPNLQPVTHYSSRGLVRKYNHWVIRNQVSGYDGYALNMRDSTHHVSIVCDTIIAHEGSSPLRVMLTNGGHFTASGGYVTMDSCYVLASGGVQLNDYSPYVTVTHNFIATTSGSALEVGDVEMIGCVFRNNTFVTDDDPRNLPSESVVFIDPLEFTTDTTKFENNIVAVIGGSHSAISYYPLDDQYDPAPADRWHRAYAFLFNHGLAGADEFFRSQWNAYFIPAYITTVGDRSLYRYDTNTYGKPATATSWCSTPAMSYRSGNEWGRDSLSVFGNMEFGNQSARIAQLFDGTTYFDPRIGYGSVAKGNGKSGVDIGCMAYAGDATISTSDSLCYGILPAGNIEVSVVVTNSGGVPLVIYSANGQSGVTTLSGGSQTIAPGASGTIVVSIHSTSTRTLIINSNDPSTPAKTVTFYHVECAG